MRLIVVVFALIAKLASWVSKAIGKGRGTSISGWLVEKYAQRIVKYFSHKYRKIILISGTNGKTTTRMLVVQGLRKAGYTVASNYGGANIYRGVAASLLKDITITGRVRSDYAVLEVEEATLPLLTKHLKADILVLTNLARDQLDVYGELDVTLRYFTDTLVNLPDVELVVNQDDSKLAELKTRADIGIIVSGSALDYEEGRGIETVYGRTVVVSENKNICEISLDKQEKLAFVPLLLGQYNLVNYGLAASTLFLCSIASDNIMQAMQTATPVFGRSEKIGTAFATHTLTLVKNPLGFSSALEILPESHSSVVIGINDNIADGKDVSWLWDVDFEALLARSNIDTVSVTGTRSQDMLVRIEQAKRAGVHIGNVQSIKQSEVVNQVLTGHEPISIFGTYTFCMALRLELEKPLGLPPIDSDLY
jgi:lipid II isoglutaminyl synthase (glutamine-hydrolysing)